MNVKRKAIETASVQFTRLLNGQWRCSLMFKSFKCVGIGDEMEMAQHIAAEKMVEIIARFVEQVTWEKVGIE